MADRRSGSAEDSTTSAEATDADRRNEHSEPEAGGTEEHEAADAEGSTSPEEETERNESTDPNRSSDPSRGTDDGEESDATSDDDDGELEKLRQAVESEYDFEDFGPEEMAEMSYEEWDAVFDQESWITGAELLDRVEADLKSRVAGREVFARIERLAADPAEGEPERLLAYSDEGYALVYPDGSVDGRGTVLRDVKPTVALCSMDEYDVAEPPEGEGLPAPSAVPEGSGELGNFMLQITAAIQLLAGVGLFVAWIALDVETIFAPVAGVVFVLAGVFLFFVVANARLSDRFRAEEYRNRLRAVGLESGERPDFLPVESGETDEDSDSTT